VALSRGLREAAEQLASAKAHAEAAESERHAASVVQRTSNESPSPWRETPVTPPSLLACGPHARGSEVSAAATLRSGEERRKPARRPPPWPSPTSKARAWGPGSKSYAEAFKRAQRLPRATSMPTLGRCCSPSPYASGRPAPKHPPERAPCDAWRYVRRPPSPYAISGVRGAPRSAAEEARSQRVVAKRGAAAKAAVARWRSSEREHSETNAREHLAQMRKAPPPPSISTALSPPRHRTAPSRSTTSLTRSGTGSTQDDPGGSPQPVVQSLLAASLCEDLDVRAAPSPGSPMTVCSSSTRRPRIRGLRPWRYTGHEGSSVASFA
jgi:hypothetical protein